MTESSPGLSRRDAIGSDPARDAIADALYRDRRMVVIGGWFVALLAAALLAITVMVRGVPAPWQLVAWSLGVAAIWVLALMLHRARREQLYRIIFLWVALIDLLLVGQLSNFYFGLERDLILQGTSPVLMLGILVSIVGARAMLKAPDANKLNLIVIISLALMTGLHAWLNWERAETHYAMLLMLATVYIAAPLCELLMRQHFRLQFTVEQSLRAALAEAQIDAREAQRRSQIDPLTGLLNREGIQAALDQALATNPQTALAQISISNLAGLREGRAGRSLDEVFAEVAAALLEVLGPRLRAGRLDGGDFLLWCAWPGEEEDWEAHCRELLQRAAAALRKSDAPPTLSLGSGCFARGHERPFALEEVSFRCFMNSVRD